MDNNQNQTGYDKETFGTGSNTTGSYDASGSSTTGGTVPENNQAPQNMKTMEEANAKKAKTSLIIGIVLCVLNLGMMCSTLLGGGFLYGGLFIILAIVGIQNAAQGKNSPKKGMATAGMVLKYHCSGGSCDIRDFRNCPKVCKLGIIIENRVKRHKRRT